MGVGNAGVELMRSESLFPRETVCVHVHANRRQTTKSKIILICLNATLQCVYTVNK